MQHEKFRKMLPTIGEFTPPETDKEGYCEMQLWVIMNTFGEDLFNGSPNIPFDTNIQIAESQLK